MMSAAKYKATSDDRPIQDYDFFKALTQLPFVEAIYLIGSRARGDHDPHSDIDLAIDCPLATDEQWTQAYLIAQKANVLVNVGLTRFERVSDPVHRDYVIHQRKLLYLRDFGGDGVVLQSRLQFIRLQREELEKILRAWETALAGKRHDEAAAQFSAAFQCIWRIVRKALIMHGLRTRLPSIAFREAYMEGWLKDRAVWERLLDAHSELAAHPDRPVAADAVRDHPAYLAAIREASAVIADIIQVYAHARAR